MSSASRRTIVLDPDLDFEEAAMEFRLTFEGPLRASNSGDRDNQPARKEYKHWVRQQFHPQLRELWKQTFFLQDSTDGPLAHIQDGVNPAEPYTAENLAKRFAMYGFNFVPLVTEAMGLLCSLDILYLRRSKPGEVLSNTGDIDNRLKTLFDCLQIPDANQNYHTHTAAEDEKPFYCLLENDKLVTKVSVETDRLLQDIRHDFPDKENDARLVITVRVKPYVLDLHNIQFG